MKKLFLLLLLPLAVKSQHIAKNADQLLSAYHKQDLFTGNVLIAKQGKVIFSKSYGMADRESEKKNNIQTTFRIGSISKSFTAVLILQLQEKGLLNIEDNLGRYFPSFPKADSIKLKHLLSNSSGIRDFIGMVGIAKWSTVKSYKELIDTVSGKSLKFTPGKEFDYSSSNFLLLAAIAEQVTGKDYVSLLNTNIIKKIGLTNTGMDKLARADKSQAMGYMVSAKNFYNRVGEMNIGILSGAGGMYSSTEDLLKFDQALYNNSLLSKKSRTLLFTPNLGNYGLGWEIIEQDGVKSIGHSGAIDGFKSNLIRFPEQNITLIILSNYYDIQSFELYGELRKVALGKDFQLPSNHNFVNLSIDKLQKYTGDYEINEKMKLTVSIKDKMLTVSLPGSGDMLLYPESEADFYIRSNNAYGKFIQDPDTNIISLQLIKGKRISTWKKLQTK